MKVAPPGLFYIEQEEQFCYLRLRTFIQIGLPS
jgi:hypothetical protein